MFPAFSMLNYKKPHHNTAMQNIQCTEGRAYPIGASLTQDGVNFSIYSKDATAIELLLFNDADDALPHIIPLSDDVNRTGHYWHIHVAGVSAGQLYGYRVYGEFDPEKGHRFDGSKVLLDPYAHAVVMGECYSRDIAKVYGEDNLPNCFKGVVVDYRGFDWEGTAPLQRPFSETVIYEMHVKGFTAHPNSGVSADKRGTYAGVIEKIPYLKSLGVTAVELLPVQQFDPFDVPIQGNANYWGYSPINFFAPHAGYSSDQSPLGPVNEFREMVKALHKAGIEVYLDVVFNHTAEGDESGPTLSFKGLQNDGYYILDSERGFTNYSGCGNTFNTNHSIPRRMIADALKYWVQQMHIDGFRFDLASVMSRDEEGVPMKNPPILWTIDTDPVLAGTKIIAEAWDAAGLYQVGTFIGDRWQEWNGKFRDHVRSFIRGDRGYVSHFADRLIGSPDLYYAHQSTPHRSINFITAHDGFTLHDLVSYNHKHNTANGEVNRDGENHNRSWNCGEEGATSDPDILWLREKQMKNFMSVLMFAVGTPMLSMGDEVGRTQQGNNNAYCQDNEISWFDWQQVDDNASLLRFTQQLIRWRQQNAPLDSSRHGSLADMLDTTKIHWHGVKPNKPDWSPQSHSIALTVKDPRTNEWVYMVINAYHEPLEFELPELEGGSWYRVLDTGLPSPDDVVASYDAMKLDGYHYMVQAHSVVFMVAQERK